MSLNNGTKYLTIDWTEVWIWEQASLRVKTFAKYYTIVNNSGNVAKRSRNCINHNVECTEAKQINSSFSKIAKYNL